MIAVLLGSVGVSVASSEYRGVHDILTTEDMSDLYFSSAVMQRCSGLYTSIAIYSDLIPKNLKDISMMNAVKGSKIATRMLNEKNNSNNHKLRVEELIRTYASIYYKKLQNSQALSGSIFSEWIKIEFSQCNRIFARF